MGTELPAFMFLVSSWVKYVGHHQCICDAVCLIVISTYVWCCRCVWYSNVESVNLFRLGMRLVLCVLPV